MVTCGIYAIRCSANGRDYVGSSNDVMRRWRGHCRLLRAGTHHCRYLQFAWNKHGEEAFSLDVLESCAKDALLEREQWHLEHRDRLFNATLIADKPPSAAGKKRSPEFCAKMRAEMARRKAAGTMFNPGIRTPEQQDALTLKLRGRKAGPVERANKRAAQQLVASRLSDAERGRRRENGRTTWLGKKLSAAHRAHLSVAMKKAVTPEALAVLHRGNVGRKRSTETLVRMSESRRRWLEKQNPCAIEID